MYKDFSPGWFWFGLAWSGSFNHYRNLVLADFSDKVNNIMIMVMIVFQADAIGARWCEYGRIGACNILGGTPTHHPTDWLAATDQYWAPQYTLLTATFHYFQSCSVLYLNKLPVVPLLILFKPYG